MLTKEELKQYNRQLILPELGISGQEKLKAAKVLIIGAGGLGCPVLQYLAAAGVGELGIADDDVVNVSNLHRQILFTRDDIGQPKVVTAKRKLQQLNPFVSIKMHQERVTSANVTALIRSYDLVVDGSDNFPTRYLINDACVLQAKPLIFGSIFKFEGQVSIFNDRQGPNYRDLFPEAPTGNAVPNCNEIGVIGILPGIIGLYMANEAIKLIVGMGETLSGKLLTFNSLDNTMKIFHIAAQKQTVQKSKPEQTKQEAQEISPDELKTWLMINPEQVQLIDVREDYEFANENLGGINIPLHELSSHMAELPTDRKLVFVCQTGHRSKIAVNLVKPFFSGQIFTIKIDVK